MCGMFAVALLLPALCQAPRLATPQCYRYGLSVQITGLFRSAATTELRESPEMHGA